MLLKAIIFFLSFVVLHLFTGCSGSTDRLIDGPPKYDTDGEQVAGDDHYIDELLEYKVVMSIIRNLDSPSGLQTISPLMNEKGLIRGVVVNNSSNRFNVIVRDKRGKKMFSCNLSAHSYLDVYLRPGKNFSAYFDGHKKADWIFNAMPDEPSQYEIVYQDGSKELVDVGFYLAKN